MEHRSEALGQVIWELVERLVRGKLATKPGGHLVESRLETLDLLVPFALTGPEADPRLFAGRLGAAVDELLDEAIERAASFRPGRAWCHRCGSADCDHGLPPTRRHVLIGYAPTGTPRWEELAQHCLEIGHPRVDELYRDPPALVTLVQRKEQLDGAMLDAFKNGSYELLGQLIVGYYPIRTRAEEGRGVVALTVQVAGSFARATRPRLGLNVLGRGPAGTDLASLWERHEELPWRRSVRWAQAALQTLVPRSRSRHASSDVRAGLERRVHGILEGLARRLEREHRARGRRTLHAEERHLSGERPTPMALSDARATPDAELLYDERSGALVVLGDRGRTHFFGKAGQLVSSVRYGRDAIERRLKHEQWTRPTPEQVASFREALALDEEAEQEG